jgi:dihydroxyacetone kinase-like predicted kinase
MQAGLSAAVALEPGRSCEENAGAMREAVAHVRTGSVTGAARDDAAAARRFKIGDAVGFVDEQLVAWGDVAGTLEAVLAELSREAELVTLIEGDGAPLAGEQVAGLAPAGVELEYSLGGQPSYWWLIAAE